MGTLILVGLGTMGILAVGGADGAAEIIAIGLAFGLALLAGIWVVGHVSGAHFNPAVTLAMLLDGRMRLSDAIGYWVGQMAGATVGSLIILATAGNRVAVAATQTTYSDYTTALVVEVTLTTVFVWTILTVVRRGASHAPLAIAMVLAGVHFVGIPFSGASVNPARSFAPAVVSGVFGSELWLYIYAPLIGAVIAFALYRLFPVADVDV